MTEVAASIVQGRAAGAYARSDSLVAPTAPRGADSARPRFPAIDDTGPRRAAPVPSGEGETRSRPERAPDRPTERGPGLLSAVTAFLTRMFTPEGGDQVQPSTILNARRAYAGAQRQADQAAQPAEDLAILAGFPRLASGRALDLSV